MGQSQATDGTGYGRQTQVMGSALRAISVTCRAAEVARDEWHSRCDVAEHELSLAREALCGATADLEEERFEPDRIVMAVTESHCNESFQPGNGAYKGETHAGSPHMAMTTEAWAASRTAAVEAEERAATAETALAGLRSENQALQTALGDLRCTAGTSEARAAAVVAGGGVL